MKAEWKMGEYTIPDSIEAILLDISCTGNDHIHKESMGGGHFILHFDHKRNELDVYKLVAYENIDSIKKRTKEVKV